MCWVGLWDLRKFSITTIQGKVTAVWVIAQAVVDRFSASVALLHTLFTLAKRPSHKLDICEACNCIVL